MAKRGRKKKKKTKKKKTSKKKKTRKKRSSKSGRLTRDAKEVNKLLIENFADFQKTMADLGERFDNLTKQISQLLNLFESAAKNFAEGKSKKENKELIEKLDKLLNQNKIIARGITLIEERVNPRPQPPQRPQQNQSPKQPRAQPQQPPQPGQIGKSGGNYLPSLKDNK
jgi:hypothetical protein